MEMTQQLECTQEVYNTQTDKTCPEQIGFLGICGTKYPVVRGPNKIGRDPQKCSIVLDYKSISRQHAVIVVNKTDFLLMDLDAANKTRLSGKVLKPFIPNPISDGDTLQFGEVIGIFRLLEDDDDLPMTQAIDIPDTPVATRCHTKTNGLATTIPESPDVSDRDDSFIVPSQPKFPKKFKSTIMSNFIQSSAKTISIQPVGSNKIDNVYWSSSKRSLSLKMDESNDSLNDSVSAKVEEKNDKTIYEMDTQVPTCNESTDSIYTAETQVPGEFNVSPSIHTLETQLPPPAENLPEVCKIDDNQQDLHFDIFTANTEPDISIFNAETQFVGDPCNSNKNDEILNNSKDKILCQEKSNTSEKEILFDEIDNESFLDEFDSQPLLSENIPFVTKIEDHVNSETVKPDNLENIKQVQTLKREVRIKSDSSTDCEDMGDLTQKLPENKVVDDDVTDCEDENEPDDNKLCPPASKDLLNKLEDMPTQIIGFDEPHNIPFEDMLTQVVVQENKSNEVEDLPTQVLPEYVPENPVYSEEMMSPFKVPLLTSVKKRKETDKTDSKTIDETPSKTSSNRNDDDDDERYYAATQELFEDLCSQRELTPERNLKSKGNHSIERGSKGNARSTNSSNSSFSDTEDKSKVRNEQGVDKVVAQMKKVPSDPSDSDLTPKKLRPFKFMTTDLPNSQEIKCHRSLTTCISTESDSDTEVENDSEEHTPILFKKKKTKVNAKVNLSEKFDIEKLPSRILTRIRKPTIKAESIYQTNTTNSILKPRYLTEQEDDIDNEIVIENITRLKNTAAKSKNKDVSKEENISFTLKETKEKQDSSKDTKKETKGKSKDKSKNKPNESVKESKSTKKLESKKKPVQTESVDSKLDSTTLNNRSTRSSRTKKNKTEASSDKKEPETTANKDKKDADHPVKVDRRKRSNKVVAKIESSPESEKEVRRSKRQRTTKKDVKEFKPVSILKKTHAKHEQSTVYNISSESNTDTPKTLKRPASDAIVESSSKRPRSNNSSFSPRSTNNCMDSTASNISLRSASSCRVKQQYVLFTAFPSDEVKSKLEKLGAIITADVTVCTVVLTMQIKRTFKLLCAVGLGKPIVGPNWVQACVDTNTIVDPWLYLMKDDAAEKRFKFSLRRTLTGKRNFLKGYKVSSTPAVMPNAQEMKLIVESSGGTWDDDLPNWVCVSTGADRALWPTLRKRGAILVSTEFILGGVLRQKLDVQGNKLQ